MRTWGWATIPFLFHTQRRSNSIFLTALDSTQKAQRKNTKGAKKVQAISYSSARQCALISNERKHNWIFFFLSFLCSDFALFVVNHKQRSIQSWNTEQEGALRSHGNLQPSEFLVTLLFDHHFNGSGRSQGLGVHRNYSCNHFTDLQRVLFLILSELNRQRFGAFA